MDSYHNMVKWNSLHDPYSYLVLARFVLIWILLWPNKTTPTHCVSRLFDLFSYVRSGLVNLNFMVHADANKGDVPLCVLCLDLSSFINISFESSIRIILSHKSDSDALHLLSNYILHVYVGGSSRILLTFLYLFLNIPLLCFFPNIYIVLYHVDFTDLWCVLQIRCRPVGWQRFSHFIIFPCWYVDQAEMVQEYFG